MRCSDARVFLSAVLLFAPFCFAAPNASRYQDTANKLIDAALVDDAGLNRLGYLCYRIGNRLSDSAALDQAIAWGADEMKKAGLANVRTIPVKVPHWVRGRESAEMGVPLQKPLFILGLGGSTATPPEGITADVVAVSTFDELEKPGKDAVQGKIVLFDVPCVTYGETVLYRSNGASRAARLGAEAALVRSITPRSLRDPHTDAMNYTATDPEIPTAAVSVEGAIAAIEMDGGAEKPVGFDLAIGQATPLGAASARSALTGGLMQQATAIAGLLKKIDATKVTPGTGEADINPLMAAGVPGFGLRTAGTHYFDYHHTQADTFDKIVPEDFKRCAAAMAAMSYVLADWP